VEELQRILVIDDAEPIRNLLQDALSTAGYTIETAADGTEGIKKLRTGRYDLIITDFDMPGATGTDIAKEVRRIKLRTPVLILTGSMLEEADRLLNFLGVRQILRKPISPIDLRSAVEGVVQDREEERREVGRVPVEDHCVITSQGSEFEGQLTSLGLKGVSLLTDSVPSLLQSEPFDLKIEFPDADTRFTITPKYFIQKPGEMVTIGGAFVDLSQDAESAVKARLESM
jgi:DNA-binding response OmpR family regulator